MAWSRNDIPDQSGRTAVITGANGGLGLETAKALASAGAHVVMAVRNETKAQNAKAEILAEAPGASLELVPLDLSSQASVREAAAAVKAKHDRIDMLINNAGVMAMPEGRTVDGYETQLGTNHLGHWTWTALLLPEVLAARAGRVVTLSSIARFQRNVLARLDADNPNLEGNYSAWKAYANSKYANLHFAIGLDRRFKKANVKAIALSAHPGLTHSDLQATTRAAGGAGLIGTASDWLVKRVGMSVPHGALSQLRAATDPRARGGTLYGPTFGAFGSPGLRPMIPWDEKGRIDNLWEISEAATGVPVEV